MSVGEEAVMCPPVVLTEGTQYVACMAQDGRLLVFTLEELRTLAGGGKGVTLMGGIDLSAALARLVHCVITTVLKCSAPQNDG